MKPGHEIRLRRRPVGMPTPGDFELVETRVPAPAEGQLLVANGYMSVDPYMLSRMDEAMVHMAPFAVGAALDGAAVGRVLQSRSERFREGDIVVHGLGWRDLALVNAGNARAVSGAFPVSAHLGVLGMPGFTAWTGLRLGGLRAQETVYVSSAAGAVGSAVGQWVKRSGGTVIGSAGSAAKATRLVEEFGFDHAFDYHGEDVGEALARRAPEGIDLYFDNVGGRHLEAAIDALRPHGRIIACGMIAHVERDLPGPANLPLIVGKRLSVRGFVISEHEDLRAEFLATAEPLLAEGTLRSAETVFRGLDRAPEALLCLIDKTSQNFGKAVVEL